MSERTQTENFKFFQHKACEFFPCHETSKPEEFNCLFCYCPLYALGDGCGGNFQYTENGIKDCTNCKVPHSKGGYDYIMSKFGEIIELVKK
jgi:Zn-finger protein